MLSRSFFVLAFSCAAALLVACGAPTTTDDTATTSAPAAMSRDPHSYARPDQVAVSHLDLDLDVDFETRRLSGMASLTLDRRGDADSVVLDTRDLDIEEITLDDLDTPVEFVLGEETPLLGRSLTVPLAADTKVVHVTYASRPEAAALQWLTPEQTTGGEHPFLFSQSQAILARTWVPCQDTPAVRMTYEAVVRVPPELMAVMSAENPTAKSEDGVYRFRMPQAIPSYLLAIAVGDLAFVEMGPRTGVYAEPSVTEKAAWEFAETEAMIDAVEPLFGTYRWGRYDLLVLPASFPFGGMENPRLTFATPTIIAGDRSLVSLVAHELAHSWSGNLVTNATWNDFWLNEGFTVYVEQRIMEEVRGRDEAEMLAALIRQGLDSEIEDMGATSVDTHLKLDLEGRDPDDGMNAIAYDKGYLFLRAIEETVGRERFDAFLRDWFNGNAFASRTTQDFVDALDREIVAGDEALAERLMVDAWIYGPGLPANAPMPVSPAFDLVDAQAEAFSGGTAAADLETDGWTTQEWLRFSSALPDAMTPAQMADLDDAFGFTASGNSEVVHAWLHHVIRNRWTPGYDRLHSFLTEVGRRKFLKPLYERLAESDDGLEMARQIYAEARPRYHTVSSGTIDEILDWEG